MMHYWQNNLTAFDAALIQMVETLTGRPCEPKNGGNHYFFEADYSKNKDPLFIMALWDAIEGRAGKRLLSIRDDATRQSLYVCVKFHEGECKDAAFIPKKER